MKVPGIVRKVDGLGRIVIPAELRKALELKDGDTLELRCEGETILLRKFAPNCIFCGAGEDLSTYQEKHICSRCLQNLKRG